MSYRCPYCKGRHQRSDTAKKCALEYYADQDEHQVKEVPKPLAVRPARHKVDVLPDGRYSIWTGPEPTVVVEIRKPVRGKWAGRYFVNLIEPGKEAALFDKAARDKVISDLLGVDFGMYMMLYGKQTGLCPVCYKPLSEAEKTIGVHLGTDDETNPRTTRDCYKVITD